MSPAQSHSLRFPFKIPHVHFFQCFQFQPKYLHEIQRTQNTFSHYIMRSTIRAIFSKSNDLNKQIIECRSQLSNVCPVLLRSIHAKIQALNSKLSLSSFTTNKKAQIREPIESSKKQDSKSRKPKPSHRSHITRKPTTFKR